MAEELTSWALPRMERLLPIDRDALRDILIYAESLPKDAAAEHLKNLLGDSSQSLDFISSFNQRRKGTPVGSSLASNSGASSRQPSPPGDGVPRARSRQAKVKKNIHALPPRKVENQSSFGGVFVKKDDEDYMAASSRGSKSKNSNQVPGLSVQPVVVPQALSASPQPSSVSLAGENSHQSSPVPTPKTSRTSSPAPNKSNPTKTKVTLVGGRAMHGASTALSDLDSAIRSLELQTNPVLSSDSASDLAKRQCNCMATRHALLTMAPNCLNCGKIICIKQGLGPCTSCSSPLLSATELHSILRILKDERGKERQSANNAAHKRAEVATKPKPFSGRDFLSTSSANTSTTPSPLASNQPSPSSSRPSSPGPDPSLAKAKEHRDRLLAYQSQNARRTHIHDEAADYSMPVQSADGSGALRGNIWASPAERALELKKQQRALREMEFNARPEWERKKVVGSIDVSTGKVVKRFVKEEFRDEGDGDRGTVGKEEEEGGEVGIGSGMGTGGNGGGGGERGKGAFSNNPLLGKMIRPVWKEGGDGDQAKEKGKGVEVRKKSTWRRVQDDLDDNEDVILDGGMKGFQRDVKVA
ncbi:hypothetical protein CAC42_2029 [Sphaceloma murrayae]|uniref:TRIP4/RQT4 C2HC5-type zinc finger domain-containing protein n=1 Tax=Sphaceloma murrayae TaxID=2082308 RepID=A0A2K1QIS9_9PEZI|nr:hypothetical protein CAC42_2029 [Sphaceloma murrayae]